MAITYQGSHQEYDVMCEHNVMTDRRHVWRSLDYGWSPWLRPKTPVPARHVRFYWEDNNDAA